MSIPHLGSWEGGCCCQRALLVMPVWAHHRPGAEHWGEPSWELASWSRGSLLTITHPPIQSSSIRPAATLAILSRPCKTHRETNSDPALCRWQPFAAAGPSQTQEQRPYVTSPAKFSRLGHGERHCSFPTPIRLTTSAEEEWGSNPRPINSPSSFLKRSFFSAAVFWVRASEVLVWQES